VILGQRGYMLLMAKDTSIVIVCTPGGVVH
jgi:hypothetical protein